MHRRIVLDEPEEHAQARAPLFSEHVKRGQGVWKYSRGTLAKLLGMQRSGVRSAEKRGELIMGDMASVIRFAHRRMQRQQRRAQADKTISVSVTSRR